MYKRVWKSPLFAERESLRRPNNHCKNDVFDNRTLSAQQHWKLVNSRFSKHCGQNKSQGFLLHDKTFLRACELNKPVQWQKKCKVRNVYRATFPSPANMKMKVELFRGHSHPLPSLKPETLLAQQYNILRDKHSSGSAIPPSKTFKPNMKQMKILSSWTKLSRRQLLENSSLLTGKIYYSYSSCTVRCVPSVGLLSMLRCNIKGHY